MFVVRGVVGGAVDLFYEPIKVTYTVSGDFDVWSVVYLIGKCTWT